MKCFRSIGVNIVGWMFDMTTSGNVVPHTFHSRYDRCGRLVYSRVPGCEPVEYRYDSYGRLAFMQDGNMRAAGRAMFTVYDAVSRVAVTGMCDDDAMGYGVKIPSMTAALDETAIGLCHTGYLVTDYQYFQNAELLTATYYDDYDFLMLDAFSALSQETTNGYASAKGLVTGTLTAVLGDADSDSNIPPIATVTFYDNEERPVRTFSTTHLADTYEQTETTYTLDGQPKTVSHTLTKGGDTYNDSYNYTYDNFARLSDVSISVPWLENFSICTDTYNSIGQLIKTVSGSSATTYSYDIRGAVSSLHNSAVNQSITRNANGTISKIIDNGIVHTFEYDKAGRLLTETCDNSTSTAGIFSSAYTYDRNSNITTLSRTGYPRGMSQPSYPVDDLTMTYDGNRLVKVTDNADEVLVEKTFDFYDGANNSAEYAYDSNGNVIRDDNRDIRSVVYNALNRPSHIEVDSNADMDYIYDAAGNKLVTRLRVAYGSYRPSESDDLACWSRQRDYIGNYEFLNDNLHRLNTPYGYWYNGCFVTNYKDYQGNNRNNADYYAYGLPVQGSNVIDQDPYLYGDKEFYPFKGINLYDFSARTYTPDIARFMQPDPKAHDYHWLSPYAYCGGDPINYIDPTGEKIYYVDMAGRLITSEEVLNKISNRPEYEAALEGLDRVVIIDQDGKIIRESDTFEEGTIQLHDNSQSELKGSDVTLWEVNGDKASKSIFEFFANAITKANNIEFGLNLMDENEMQAINDVFTTHKTQSLSGSTSLIKMRYFEHRWFRELIHSHKCTPIPSSTDVTYMNALNRYLKKRKMNPIYKLYNAQDNKYYEYDSNTKYISK